MDGKGHITSISKTRPRSSRSTRRMRWYQTVLDCSVHGAEGSGDRSQERALYSVCTNKMMIVSDPVAGKVLATPAIGAGDEVWRLTRIAFAANGADGTIRWSARLHPGNTSPRDDRTQRSARTIASDQKAHKLYLPAAEYGPPAAEKDGKKAGRRWSRIVFRFGRRAVSFEGSGPRSRAAPRGERGCHPG